MSLFLTFIPSCLTFIPSCLSFIYLFVLTAHGTCHLLPFSNDIINRPFSHCFCAYVYRSRGALFPDNRRDFTEMGQTDFKSLILSM